jgi:hypothetical protein
VLTSYTQTCRACISITQTNNHKCIERATDADCPICGENMFASHKTVIFMDCGHSIHRTCFNEYMASSYKCPICSKSIVNMEALFTNLANIIREQPMPQEFENVTSTILCNDCSAKCTTKYHFLGLRCQICRSYNTVELERSEMPGERAESEQTPAPGHPVPATPAHPERSLQDRTSGSNSASELHTNPTHAQYNLSQDAERPTSPNAQAVPESYAAIDEEDDEELDFWGGEARSGPESEDDDDYEDDTDPEESDNEEDDDNDDEDIMLFGHR